MPTRKLLAAVVLFAWLAPPVRAQQVADTGFDARVARPAFTTRYPRVLFDEAHHNFHTAFGRYKPFAELIAHDGCVIAPNRRPFSAATLAGYDVLVISNALGVEDMSDTAAAHPAFTPPECDAVRDWVKAGGALLLIADHAPMGAAARPLARRFGVDMRSAYTIDPVPVDSTIGNPGLILFTPAHGLDTRHPIMRGRDSTERVRRVLTFTGQSLTGPPGSVQLLTLSSTAQDLMVGFGQAGGNVPPEKRRSAAGRAQGLAFAYGKGRVVVMGEAAMLSAQLAGPGGQFRMGMNYPGTDNRQLALNIVRWLAHGLE